VARDYAGEGEPILLLHGGPGVPDYLAPAAEMLVPRYRAVTFDQRGVGGSTAKSHRYEPEDYLENVDAVRRHLDAESIHLFGHSWGGLLAQLYLARYPSSVRSLFLASSSPGVGSQWKRNEQEVFGFNRRRAGALGFAAMGWWWRRRQLVMALPGPLGDAGARRLMRRVWANYFPEPRNAPPADPAWLRGVRSEALRSTPRALRRAPETLLDGVTTALAIPILVLFAADDIYETAAEVLRSRFPEARHLRLEQSGHLP
jgi:proline iminopeptidase